MYQLLGLHTFLSPSDFLTGRGKRRVLGTECPRGLHQSYRGAAGRGHSYFYNCFSKGVKRISFFNPDGPVNVMKVYHAAG